MQTNQTIQRIAFVLLAALLAVSCSIATSSTSRPDNDLTAKVQTRIKPLVEALYLNTREQLAIYGDLRSVAQAHALGGDDKQLNYLQKAALYVQKTHLSSWHQWEMLSIMEDIRDEARLDYYTLRRKGLHQAMDEEVYDERFITIYQTQISHAEAQKDIQRALKMIQRNRKIYRQLIDAIAPLVSMDGDVSQL